jgi:ABC-type amino acid transport substrate-binding protein
MNSDTSITKERRTARLSRTTAIAVIAAVLFVSLIIIKPSAPENIVLLTGPEGSSYHEMGKTLAASLDKIGLETEVRVTRGGIDNAKQLAVGAANTVALAPSNIERLLDPEVEIGDLVSLGSIAFEPFWLFSRSEFEVVNLADLAGLRVVPGATDTVAYHMAMVLLKSNNVLDQVEIVSFDDHTPEDAEAALVDGRVDAVFANGTPASPLIMGLLGHPDLSCLSFDRTEAYEAWYPGIARIIIPEGIADLENNLPGEDLVLLSATTNLLTFDSLYPGVVPLVLQAVTKTDDRRRFTTTTTTFPNGENTSVPLDRAAARYYDHGETGLGKHLPYKVTRWINHLGYVVLPLLTLSVLLLKLVPMGLKIFSSIKLTGMLKQLESVEKAHAAGADPTELLAQLDELDRKTAEIFVSRSMVHDYIDDRQFLHDMRERVTASESTTHAEKTRN